MFNAAAPIESIHGNCEEQGRYRPREWAFAPEGRQPQQEEVAE